MAGTLTKTLKKHAFLSILSAMLVILASAVVYAQCTDPAGTAGEIEFFGDSTGSLVGYWKLDETSGNFADSSGNGLTGTADSISYNQPGYFDGAARFPSNGSDINIGTSGLLNIPNGTISTWVNYTTASLANGTILSKNASGNNDGDLWLRIDDNSGFVLLRITDGGSDTTIQSDAAVTNGEWTHIAVTFGTGGMKMYINGVLQADTDALTRGMENAAANLYLGNVDGGAWSLGSNNYLDEVRIYDRELNPTEINTVYNSSPIYISGSGNSGLQYCDGTDWVTMCPPAPACDTTPIVYSTAGGPYTFDADTDAPGCNNITIEAYGAGGGFDVGGGGGGSVVLDTGTPLAVGGGGGGGGNNDGGGGGGYGEATVSISSGDSFDVYVGGGGECVDGAGGELSGGAYDGQSLSGPATAGNSTYGGGGGATLSSASSSSINGGDSTYGGGGAAHCSSGSSHVMNGGDSTYGGGGGLTQSFCTSSTLNYGSSTNGNAGTSSGGGGGGGLGDSTATGTNGSNGTGGTAANSGPGNGAGSGCTTTASDGQVIIIPGSSSSSLSTDGNLAGYWKLDENTGTDTADSSGNGNDGTFYGGYEPSWTSDGYLNSALTFDGSGELSEVPHSASLDITGNLSIAFWFMNYDNAAAGWDVVGKTDGGLVNDRWQYSVQTFGDEIGLFFCAGPNAACATGGPYTPYYNFIHTTSANFANDQWYHVVLTYDDGANDIQIYVDGVAQSLTVNVGQPSGNPENNSIQSNTHPLRIGWSGYASSETDGKIDEMRIYDITLTPTEVDELYQSYFGGGGGGSGGTQTCTSVASCSTPGQYFYDSVSQTMRWCDGTDLYEMGEAIGGGSPSGDCPTIGSKCSDGSIYAGLTTDDGSRILITDTDQSTNAVWKATTGNNDIDPDSDSDGRENHANVTVAISSLPAMNICETLDLHGRQDWYLPSIDEFEVVFDNVAAIDASATDDLSPNSYWTSKEGGSNNTADTYSTGGRWFLDGKDDPWFYTRCIRRDTSGAGSGGGGYGSCSSPSASAGALNYNEGTDTFQFCNGTDWVNIGK